MSEYTPPSTNGDSRDGPEEPGTTSTPAADNTSPSQRQPNSNVKRGARTLTAAQLEKKRANDREAQRAIRERTKTQIESLEKRIKDLESGEAYQQLRDALREKQMVEAENADLRSRLNGIMDILKPLYPAGTVAGHPAPSANRAIETHSVNKIGSSDHSSVTMQPPPSASRDSYNPHSRSPNASSTWHHSRQAAGSPPPPWEQTSKYNNHSYHRSADSGHENRPEAPALSSAPKTSPPPGKRQRTSYDTSNGARTPLSASGPMPPDDVPASVYTALPVNINPTCRYDSILNDFITASRGRLAAGESLAAILGGTEPIMNNLVDSNASSSYFSSLLIDLLKGFSAISRMPLKVCIVTNLFTFVQWMVSPTKETWNALPPYMYPVEAQLKVPHPIWVDHIPWPSMRHKMVYQYPWLPLDNFFMPYTLSLQLSYSRDDVASCLYRDPKSGDMLIQPDLIEHIRDLESFSLGPAFAKALPSLADTCRIRDE